jgi:hypothetical protein
LLAFLEEKIQYNDENLFSYDYQSFKDENSKKQIYDFINEDGVCLILCDGGSKKNEFRLISPLLKNGDVIMAHDYSPNNLFFEDKMKNKYWNWMEIQDSDISNSCEGNNLLEFMFDEFITVGWVCKIKK